MVVIIMMMFAMQVAKVMAYEDETVRTLNMFQVYAALVLIFIIIVKISVGVF